MIITTYTDPTDSYFRFIRTFNKDPGSFNVDECLASLKTIELDEDDEINKSMK